VGVDRLAEEHSVRIRWRAFPLRPGIPVGGLPLEEALDTDPDEAWAVVRSLRDTAAEFGLPFGELRRVSNSRLAQELAAWAASRGRERAAHDALFRAFFVEGKDIGDVGVLGALAEDAGLGRGEAIRVLEARSFGELVDADWARSRELGIRVAPTFVRAGRRLEGVKPYDVLEAWFRGDTLSNSF
jgi:predicted DsbA family dithiol-disulfide isomerase